MIATKHSTTMPTRQAHSTQKIDRVFQSLAAMQKHIRDYLWEEIFTLRVIRLKDPDDTTSYNELLSLFDLENQLTIGTIFDDDKPKGYRKLTYEIYSMFLHNLERAEGFVNPITSVRSFDFIASKFTTKEEGSKIPRPMTPEEFHAAILEEWRLFDTRSE